MGGVKHYILKHNSINIKINNVNYFLCMFYMLVIKDAISSLRQLLATENPLKMTTNAFISFLRSQHV